MAFLKSCTYLKYFCWLSLNSYFRYFEYNNFLPENYFSLVLDKTRNWILGDCLFVPCVRIGPHWQMSMNLPSLMAVRLLTKGREKCKYKKVQGAAFFFFCLSDLIYAHLSLLSAMMRWKLCGAKCIYLIVFHLLPGWCIGHRTMTWRHYMFSVKLSPRFQVRLCW